MLPAASFRLFTRFLLCKVVPRKGSMLAIGTSGWLKRYLDWKKAERHGGADFGREHACLSIIHRNSDGPVETQWASQVVLVGKNLPASMGDPGDSGSIAESGRSPGVGCGNPLQYSHLENPMGREAWPATVRGASWSWTRQRMRASRGDPVEKSHTWDRSCCHQLAAQQREQAETLMGQSSAESGPRGPH